MSGQPPETSAGDSTPRAQSAELVSIGRIWRARGIRGELLGELDSEQPDREERLKSVILDHQGRRQKFSVEEVWRHGGQPVFKFAGIDTMTEAERWEKSEILVEPEDVVPPPEGEYSHRDLVGSVVIDAASGNHLGVVARVDVFGGPDLLAVQMTDGREVLLPFAKAICREIDVAAKTIRVDVPEGLLDL